MRNHLATVLLFAGLAALPAGVAAQEATDSATSAATSQLADAEKQFVEAAAGAGKAEVELGQMALEKAESQEVKDFGQMMVDDHSKTNDQLMQIAQQKQLEVPDELPPEAQEAQQRLNGLAGAEFDRAYIDQMITDHEKTIELFQTEADNGQDAELKQFAQQTLPTLERHLKQAQQIDMQMTEQAGATGEAMQPEGSPEATAPAAGAAGAPAEDTTTEQATETTTQPESSTTTEAGDTQQAAAPPSPFGQMTADELIGKEVTNESGDAIGEIQDIVINKQDQAMFAVVSVGGFLGIGDKHVAVPFDQLQQGENDSVLISGATEDELKQMPEHDESAGTYEPYPREQPLGGG